MSRTLEYKDFLRGKSRGFTGSGITDGYTLSPDLKPFQADIVRWALAKGRAAIFADCGLGKTFMQLQWADIARGDGAALILAPLAVADQTKSEGDRWGFDINVCETGDDVRDGINITNYEKLHNFDADAFNAVVLDESSIIKNYTGKMRDMILAMFNGTQYKLACTATPSPNDHMELGNHSEFLSVMSRNEMLARFFVNDMQTTQKWRLKGHASDEFWRWVASWAVVVRSPSDLGHDNAGYDLPPLNFIEHITKADAPTGQLFHSESLSLSERRDVRKKSINARAESLAERINATDEQWLVWCDYNYEADAIMAIVPDAVEVRGDNKPDQKSDRMMAFTRGDIRVLVTKPKIAGFGMNWQNCKNVAFVGMSDSYEMFYQSVRRCWRFGQPSTVDVHIAYSDAESVIVDNIKRKQDSMDEMVGNVIQHMKESMKDQAATETIKDSYDERVTKSDHFTLYRGDCVEMMRNVESDSVGYSIFSPPFASLYTYSNSDRDMGNCASDGEFVQHFKYLVDELHRVMMPGRNVSFHCMNLPTSKARDGVIGIRDFRGELICIFEDAGFIFHSEVCIWKDPVVAMQRTKALGLLHKQLKKDSCMSRQGIPDYLVTMRKIGDNDDRVSHDNETFPVGEWQKYAQPVWMDINPSDTLQYRSARADKDEKHICPLQLEVIRRGLRLWSREGDTVLTPFAGIGSEMYCAIESGRDAIGIELKESYYEQAARNCKYIESNRGNQQSLFEASE